MQVNDQRVREFAYHIWESEGRPHGQAARHWEMACKLANSQSKNKSKPQSGTATEALESFNSPTTALTAESAAAKPAKKARTAKASPAVPAVKTAATKTKAKPKAELASISEVDVSKPAKTKKIAAKEKQVT